LILHAAPRGFGPWSPAKRLHPLLASGLTWNCGTTAGPGARTGSAAPRTPGRNLPLHGYQQNQLWCEIVALACDLLAWTAMLALTGTARRWEPRKLRLRLLSAAGRIVRGGRRLRLRLAAQWPWARDITAAISRLQALAPG
jgi:hypothetical protein